MIGNLFALAAGLLFAAGLAISGMTQPDKVIGFLDFTGSWDPSLGMVMVGALLTYGVGTRFAQRRKAPIDGGDFEAVPRNGIDARLLVGAAMFGVGWGLGGFCPGPGIVSVGPLSLAAIVFVGAMLGGQALFEVWDRRTERSDAEQPAPEGATATVPVVESTRSLPSCG